MSEEINNAKLAEKAHEEQMKSKEEAESSKITPLTAVSKTVTIREDTDQEYQLKLQFPGVEEATEILENSRNPFGAINRPELLRESLKHVIIQPKIKSIKWWNDHEGLYEAAEAVLNFLTEKL